MHSKRTDDKGSIGSNSVRSSIWIIAWIAVFFSISLQSTDDRDLNTWRIHISQIEELPETSTSIHRSYAFVIEVQRLNFNDGSFVFHFQDRNLLSRFNQRIHCWQMTKKNIGSFDGVIKIFIFWNKSWLSFMAFFLMLVFQCEDRIRQLEIWNIYTTWRKVLNIFYG